MTQPAVPKHFGNGSQFFFSNPFQKNTYSGIYKIFLSFFLGPPCSNSLSNKHISRVLIKSLFYGSGILSSHEVLASVSLFGGVRIGDESCRARDTVLTHIPQLHPHPRLLQHSRLITRLSFRKCLSWYLSPLRASPYLLQRSDTNTLSHTEKLLYRSATFINSCFHSHVDLHKTQEN